MAPAQLIERLNSLEQSQTELKSQNAQLSDENAELRAQVEWFKRNLFGAGKSEKIDALKTRLGLGEEDSEESPEQQKQHITYERRKKAKRPPPAEQFADLPVRETVEVIPDEIQMN